MTSATVHSRFWAILLLSLVLHAGLFLFVLWQRKASFAALPPIVVSLRLVAPSESPSPSESGSAVVAPASPAPSAPAIPQKVGQYPSQNKTVSPRSVIPTAGPANQPVSALSSASSAAPVASETPSLATSAPVQSASPAVAVRSDSELLDGYRRRLGELFARQQEYPRIAAMRGWEGEVRLRLKVARKGQLLSIHLDRTSGYPVLDEYALAMLETLASLPPLPEALEANEIQVVVPINYKLKKTT